MVVVYPPLAPAKGDFFVPKDSAYLTPLFLNRVRYRSDAPSPASFNQRKYIDSTVGEGTIDPQIIGSPHLRQITVYLHFHASIFHLLSNHRTRSERFGEGRTAGCDRLPVFFTHDIDHGTGQNRLRKAVVSPWPIASINACATCSTSRLESCAWADEPAMRNPIPRITIQRIHRLH